MRRHAPELLAFVCLVGLTVQACTHEKALVVSGETLVVLGEQFVATGAAMNKALDDKAITPEAYRTWATFAKKFKAAYPLARDLWKTAEETKDERLMAQVGAIVAQLGADLGAYAALIEVH